MHKEGGNFTCPHCQKTFTENPNIRKHIGPFHAEKRFSCTVCTKSFTGGDKLKTHLVRHSEAKDFMCDDCGEQCKRKDKLGEHGKRMHNVLSKKERPVVVPTDHPADSGTRGKDLKGQERSRGPGSASTNASRQEQSREPGSVTTDPSRQERSRDPGSATTSARVNKRARVDEGARDDTHVETWEDPERGGLAGSQPQGQQMRGGGRDRPHRVKKPVSKLA